MDGYEVLTEDGDEVGTVVATHGRFLVVEHDGTRRPLPTRFVSADDEARIVRTTRARPLLASAPEVGDDGVDERAAARHFGLAGGEDAPDTLGYGDVLPDDPAWSAERQEERNGLESSAEQRVRLRESL